MKQKAVSNIMQNHSNFAFWGRQGCGKMKDTFEEGWIGLIPLYECVTWVWKQSFLSFWCDLQRVKLLSSCVCDLKSGPPSLLCFAVWSGYLVVVFVYVTEFAAWSLGRGHPSTCIPFCLWNHGGGFIGAVRTWWIYQIVLSSRDSPLYPVLLDAPRDTFWLISGENMKKHKVVSDGQVE